MTSERFNRHYRGDRRSQQGYRTNRNPHDHQSAGPPRARSPISRRPSNPIRQEREPALSDHEEPDYPSGPRHETRVSIAEQHRMLMEQVAQQERAPRASNRGREQNAQSSRYSSRGHQRSNDVYMSGRQGSSSSRGAPDYRDRSNYRSSDRNNASHRACDDERGTRENFNGYDYRREQRYFRRDFYDQRDPYDHRDPYDRRLLDDERRFNPGNESHARRYGGTSSRDTEYGNPHRHDSVHDPRTDPRRRDERSDSYYRRDIHRHTRSGIEDRIDMERRGLRRTDSMEVTRPLADPPSDELRGDARGRGFSRDPRSSYHENRPGRYNRDNIMRDPRPGMATGARDQARSSTNDGIDVHATRASRVGNANDPPNKRKHSAVQGGRNHEDEGPEKKTRTEIEGSEPLSPDIDWSGTAGDPRFVYGFAGMGFETWDTPPAEHEVPYNYFGPRRVTRNPQQGGNEQKTKSHAGSSQEAGVGPANKATNRQENGMQNGNAGANRQDLRQGDVIGAARGQKANALKDSVVRTGQNPETRTGGEK